MKLAALIQYKGTDYSGFQRQNNAPSIQEVIEDALHIITQEDCKINYAGRTDAGVHALSQTFDFTTNIERDYEDWIKGLNSNLPNSLLVTQIIKVDDDFHSRFSALARSYTYCIYNSNQKPIFFADYVHWEKRKIDITKIQNQISAFKGEHDFSAFRSSNCNSKNPTKNISEINLSLRENYIFLNITANAFLQNMVRIIAGTLVDIGKGENTNSIKDIIISKDRTQAGRTLSSQGLFFLGPHYDQSVSLNTPSKNILEFFN